MGALRRIRKCVIRHSQGKGTTLRFRAKDRQLPQIALSPDRTAGLRLPLAVRVALLTLGFIPVVAQIVLMRELMVVFCGNEASFGILLATWLLCTAVGASVVGRWLPFSPRVLVAALQVTLALALPASVVLARCSRALLPITPGELLGPGAILILSFVSLSAFCVLSGWLFAAGSQLYSREASVGMAGATGAAYLFDAAGSAGGGLLASILLIRFCSDLQLAIVVSMVSLASAALLAGRSAPQRILLCAIVGVLAAGALHASPRWDAASLGRLWLGSRLIATRSSMYGNLAIVETEGTSSLYENGLIAFTAKDQAAAEESVHFALLQHPSPARVLLIGGGVNGSLAQVLKHASVEHVDYVELDPQVIAMAHDYFPEVRPSMADSRVRVHSMDGRFFLKNSAQTYDAIVVNLPDPVTAQLNRFYTREFFAEAAAKLRPGGVFSFSVHGSENYVGPELAEFLRCLNRTLRQVFAAVAIVPGDTVHFSASASEATLAWDAAQMLDRLRARRLDTLYVSEYYLPFRMSPERMEQLREQVRPGPKTRVNSDFSPVAYYFGIALWSARFRADLRAGFFTLAQLPFNRLLAFVLLGTVSIVLACLRGAAHRRRRAAAGYCVAATGMTLMSVEMLLLLGFQAIYGYLYYQLAVVVAGFMTGMALGSWGSQQPAGRPSMDKLVMIQMLAAGLPLLVYVSLLGFSRWAGSTLTPLVVAAFPLLATACGFLGGYQFRAASRAYHDTENSGSRGGLYGLDLLGAAVGALVVGTYLVPVFGVAKTATVIAWMNVPPAMLAFASRREQPPLRN